MSEVPSRASGGAGGSPPRRVTLQTLRQRVRDRQRFAMLTCYDAITAGWLVEGGVDVLLVGDTAAQMILGHDSTLPVSMDFLVELTGAVRRGAPRALVMADMPFGSYQCGDDRAMLNAGRFLKESGADCVKLEVDQSHASLVERMARGGIPVVAHIGAKPQHVRASGGFRSTGKTRAEAQTVAADARAMLDARCSMLLVEAVPAEVGACVVELAEAATDGVVPVIGCGAGPACHGHVVVLHDLLGLTRWQPPFALPMARLGPMIAEVAAQWARRVTEGGYLKDQHPYRMMDQQEGVSD
ncbi:MAG: 3-methyl-2-oxobutanoate hydroxymethyltransferase [Phycisphaeraceae bacterium]|nr:3-methyl-2-oxobutanoate hydroxymethyltransferase [Phycisphaeraceae bacterium]